ncbi:hypothetical protein BMS3Abin15_00370 [bacterium BMS3Abin15]|nr:hypothetical protein BMS3Abin15_00370 [bacterium BMS3Abin15]
MIGVGVKKTAAMQQNQVTCRIIGNKAVSVN